MNKSRLYIHILLTYILSNSFVFADIADGDSFLKYIKVTDHENVNSITGFYDGYINGVADSTANIKWCPPPNFKRNQLLKTVTKYYKENTNYSSETPASAKDLILSALIDVYPCEK